MKKALIGGGGFAREVKAHLKENIPCFVDDIFWKENNEGIYKISSLNFDEYEILIAIGDSIKRFEIYNKLPKNAKYFSFVHPSAQILDNNIEIGEGSIICANTILTTNIKIGNHCHLNLSTTIGHDCIIGDFFTTAPAVNISGNCKIGNYVYFGTNSAAKQGVNICDNVTIGMGGIVVKNITKEGVYIGNPTKILEK
jgi:sugar O-acyltransferase (sialic acid O-acetyltransferase NeuD family)